MASSHFLSTKGFIRTAFNDRPADGAFFSSSSRGKDRSNGAPETDVAAFA
jgi:hypothetical protein